MLNDSEGIGTVEHLSELNRHDCAVNVVRFHPTEDIIASASDGELVSDIDVTVHVNSIR